MTTRREWVQDALERRALLGQHPERLVPLVAAVVAVLASIGTLSAHHRSIAALSAKNDAIVVQSKASDQYSYYEAKQIRYTIYSALVAGGVGDAAARKSLKSTADHERTSSLAILARAQGLSREAQEEQERSEVTLKSFETLEIATTMFEVAIVLVSLSTVAAARGLIYFGAAIGAVGIIFLLVGLFQPH